MLSSMYSNIFDKDYVPAYISDEDSGVYSSLEEKESSCPHDDPLRPIEKLPTAPPTPPPGPRPGPFGPRPDVPTPPPSP
ncbi:hypothetical protein CORC01_01343 [Colletotrichum orchidophilum]|uniref:Uncharacterized protein n=1 Tax=Colletotrichum orchidophilum TaxID=1209926 RepID=A0A1G4BP96_9PEZI|nr:uncharacterized protein CORC01_01343 [Colletotrichum orchidophilum]OHF03290.1 hypothetical protein CORC01_01343 [Colletotrichum orchidophilum]